VWAPASSDEASPSFPRTEPSLSTSARSHPGWLDIAVLGGAAATALLEPLHLAFGRSVGVWLAIPILLDVLYVAAVVVDRIRARRHQARQDVTLLQDILGNVPLDWLILLMGEPHLGGISLYVVLRLNRLVRLGRGWRVLQRWNSRSRTRSAGRRLIVLLTGWVLFNHWAGCVWFLASSLAGHPKGGWVDKAGLIDAPAFEQYLRSAYWAVTTVTTVGYGDISPGVQHEYILAVGAMLAGSLIHVLLIGGVASALANVDATRTKFFDQASALSSFLRSRGAGGPLLERVTAYHDHVWDLHGGHAQDKLLRDLPGPLRTEVMLALAGPLLERVPLFRASGPSLRAELVAALKFQVQPPHAVIVRPGTAANELVFISDGFMEVIDENGVLQGQFGPGDHFGLLSMMLSEQRTATVRTTTYCDVFVLQRKDFEELKAQRDEFSQVLREVGRERSELMSELLLMGIVL
jgi:hypothetical protein